MVYDEAWKDFFYDDSQTQRVLDGSEVFRNYERAEHQREALRQKLAVDRQEQEEREVLAMLEGIEEQIAKRPALKKKLAEAKRAIETVPGLREKVDPRLVRAFDLIGLSLTEDE